MNVANSMLVAEGNGLTLINPSQTNQAVLASYEYYSFQLDWLNLLDFDNIVIADKILSFENLIQFDLEPCEIETQINTEVKCNDKI